MDWSKSYKFETGKSYTTHNCPADIDKYLEDSLARITILKRADEKICVRVETKIGWDEWRDKGEKTLRIGKTIKPLDCECVAINSYRNRNRIPYYQFFAWEVDK